MMWIVGLLALYGFCAVVWSLYRWGQSRLNLDKEPLTIVLSVRDAESYIEGVLRELIAVCNGVQDVNIIVITQSAHDAAAQIIRKMQEQHDLIRLVTISTQTEVPAGIGSAFVTQGGFGAYFDIATSDGARKAVEKVKALCGD